MDLRPIIGFLSGIALTTVVIDNDSTPKNKETDAHIATLVASAGGFEESAAKAKQKATAINLNSASAALVPPADNRPHHDAEPPHSETEVIQIDTVSTRIEYTIRHRIIEEVDTISAIKVYEIRKKMVKRTTAVDTLTEIENQKKTVAFQQGNFSKLKEQVEIDTVVAYTNYQAASLPSSRWKVDLSEAKQQQMLDLRSSKWKVDLTGTNAQKTQEAAPQWQVDLSEAKKQQMLDLRSAKWKVDMTRPQKKQAPRWKVDLSEAKTKQMIDRRSAKWKVDLTEAGKQPASSRASKWKVDLSEAKKDREATTQALSEAKRKQTSARTASPQSSRWKVDLREAHKQRLHRQSSGN